ncbi:MULTISPECIES: hypothetical protein [unclassified Acinetobacter]|uniref:Uncharacterized protein n=1 Tax=Acinetobacter piscicola TaxID=2006115 RepID=A0A7S6VYR0_9GAMM|nr:MULTISPECIES: hypothetical protein [unclassified Acinetobacter]MDM1756862.1 hypothetical protein [Acinetobacter sp. 256-1]MDM1759949.1 hypothetical protein [Acinetobacter sp. 251-1]QOW47337.1 hypothetical protein G0028_16405 [Acinetobacter piscicola]
MLSAANLNGLYAFPYLLIAFFLSIGIIWLSYSQMKGSEKKDQAVRKNKFNFKIAILIFMVMSFIYCIYKILFYWS